MAKKPPTGSYVRRIAEPVPAMAIVRKERVGGVGVADERGAQCHVLTLHHTELTKKV